jgi:hypothetical protein
MPRKNPKRVRYGRMTHQQQQRNKNKTTKRNDKADWTDWVFQELKASKPRS